MLDYLKQYADFLLPLVFILFALGYSSRKLSLDTNDGQTGGAQNTVKIAGGISFISCSASCCLAILYFAISSMRKRS